MATLESLSRCRSLGRVAKVFVINNGRELLHGELNELHRVDCAAQVECLQVACRNKSLALNAAVQEIRDPNSWVILLDDDVTASPQLLEEYIAAFAQHAPSEKVYFGGGCCSDVAKQEIEEQLQPHVPLCVSGLDIDSYGKALPEWFFLGFNWALPYRAFADVGLFNPAFGPGSPSHATGSETEFQRRLFKAEYLPIFLPRAKVTHRIQDHGITLRWLLRRKFRNGVEYAQHILMNVSTLSAVIKSLKLLAAFLSVQWLCLWSRGDPTSHKCRRAFHRGVAHGVRFYWRRV
jgi:GT2 family glycosyltransferase